METDISEDQIAKKLAGEEVTLQLGNLPTKSTKYLLGIMMRPWTKPKPRTERQSQKKVKLQMSSGVLELSWQESRVLGFRELHSDSEGNVSFMLNNTKLL